MADYKSVGWIEDIFKGSKSDWKTADRSILDIVKNVGEMNQLFPSQEDNLMNETLRGDDHRSLLRLEKILLNADGRKRVKRKILEDVDKLMNRENKGSRQEMDKIFNMVNNSDRGGEFTEDIEPLGASNYKDRLSRKYNITSVESAQKLLSKAGYNLGPTEVDGIYGPFTEKAWMNFAKDEANYWEMAPKMYGKKPNMSDLLDHLITKNAIRSQRK